MKRLTLFGLFLAFVFSLNVLSYGQNQISEEKRQLISELIALNKTEKQIAEVTDIMLDSMETTYLIGFNQSIEKRTDLSQVEKDKLKSSVNEYFLSFSKKFRERLPKAVNYTKYVEDTVYPLYDKFFTTEEVKDLVAFYKTPTGKKVIETMPLLFKESHELAQKYLLPDILKLLDEIMQEDLKNIGQQQETNNH
jgi:uncharacterized protein